MKCKICNRREQLAGRTCGNSYCQQIDCYESRARNARKHKKTWMELANSVRQQMEEYERKVKVS